MPTTNDNSSERLFRITWPVYKNYDIMQIENYIEYMEKKTQKPFPDAAYQLLRCQHETLDNTYVIFPTTDSIYESYNPVYDKPNAFFDLSKVIVKNQESDQTIPRVHENIIEWIRHYGLPCNTVMEVNSHALVDQVPTQVTTTERLLQGHFGHYAMLRQKFLALALDANRVSNIFNSHMNIAKKFLEPTWVIADPSMTLNREIAEKKYTTHSEVNQHLKSELKALFEQRINSYSTKVSLGLEFNEIPVEPYFKYEMVFNIPDLITALWYQFYMSITDVKNLGVCKECHHLFVQSRPNQKFCPSIYDPKKSDCKNKYNVRKSREGAQNKEAAE